MTKEKVDREDLKKLIACFSRQDDKSYQQDAIKSFRHWMQNPEYFEIDDDLRVKVMEIPARHA